ncbi:hypothetical protein [Fimbriiglobus ruber]|uniref:hypothetical protein n=1 Tax=Fimbriiglobus ruber TaxID=1908690 RepID=UPI00137972D6|nr:hypothetical protein [Fimbriiglobus ruber]
MPSLQSKPDATLPLRGSGEQVPIFHAVLVWHELTAIQEHFPEVFANLVAVASGQTTQITSESKPVLVEHLLINETDLDIHPSIPAVLRASYQATPDGVVLVNPLVARTEADRAAIEENEQVWNQCGAMVRDVLNRRTSLPQSWVDRAVRDKWTPIEPAGRGGK